MQDRTATARRGNALREHILWTARELFLEVGFERTSMDEVAARAGTTKRTVYAHFENKEKLFRSTFEFLRGFFLARLGTPDTYAADPAEALALFLARFMEKLLWDGAIRTCRICIAEAARFPIEAADYCYVIFTEVESRVAAYLRSALGLSPEASQSAAEKLLGQVLHPRFPRALFGVDPPLPMFDDAGLSPNFDVTPMRRAVGDFVGSLEREM